MELKNLTYSELLLHPKWRQKREEIIIRDGYSCLQCDNRLFLEDAYLGYFKILAIKESTYHLMTDGYQLNSKRFTLPHSAFNRTEYKVPKYVIYIDPTTVQKFNKPFVRPLALRESEIADVIKIHGPEVALHLPETFINAVPSEKYKWIYSAGLHVHHTFYQSNKWPWEYPSASLETVCWKCHEQIHSQEQIPSYSEDYQLQSYLTPCYRCYGAGELPVYQHIQDGICFRCHGARYEELIK